ncbi:MAG: hypothetical protein A2V77_12665 [Anaeromyxobacter sp. RBG_16_69_14]|nr:MAG: hypothetical protein A2V77_12665 [Anaeromyxobacter sp. RBG_16_69_14]
MRTGEVKDEHLAAWGFERDIPADLAIDAALHEIEPPDLALALVANRGDHITVQVLKGQPPLPDGFIYVKRHRLFEIVRAERWPTLPDGSERLLLILRAYPSR